VLEADFGLVAVEIKHTSTWEAGSFAGFGTLYVSRRHAWTGDQQRRRCRQFDDLLVGVPFTAYEGGPPRACPLGRTRSAGARTFTMRSSGRPPGASWVLDREEEPRPLSRRELVFERERAVLCAQRRIDLRPAIRRRPWNLLVRTSILSARAGSIAPPSAPLMTSRSLEPPTRERSANLIGGGAGACTSRATISRVLLTKRTPSLTAGAFQHFPLVLLKGLMRETSR